MRKTAWITAAAAATALLVGGCSDSSDDDDQTIKVPSGDQQPGGDNQGKGSLDGAWSHTDGTLSYLLNIEGTKASLAGGNGTLCNGEVADMGAKTLQLTCTGGDNNRTLGRVEVSGDGKTLKVDWDAIPEETYTRVDIPTDLPTGDMPSNMPPGDLPSGLPSIPGPDDFPTMDMPSVPPMPSLPG